MKLFDCPSCGLTLFFENTRCESCGRPVGYAPQTRVLTSLDAQGGAWVAQIDGASYRFCRNAEFGCCNWLIPTDSESVFCLACRHNEVIPDLSFPTNLALWRKIEIAKHRLFYSLLRLRLPIETRTESPTGLIFDFLSDVVPHAPPVLTGHDNGRITISLAEADDAERERRRSAVGEPYRTLLGHFRHEIGHYYWARLVSDKPAVEECRNLFGDDRADYGAALQNYYKNGPAADWSNYFVSAYATSHPWEDFAETWAHYLHILDTLEMATAFDVEIRALPLCEARERIQMRIDWYAVGEFEVVANAWAPLTIALNSLNRCMGQRDLYPFVLSRKIVEKLAFIHRIVQENARQV